MELQEKHQSTYMIDHYLLFYRAAAFAHTERRGLTLRAATRLISSWRHGRATLAARCAIR